LGDILAVANLGQVDLDAVVGLVLLGVVLGRPADAKGVADGGDGHLTELATIGLGDWVSKGLIRTWLSTSSAVRARKGRVGVLVNLLVVTVGVGRVKGTEGLAKREATGITCAGTILPFGGLGVFELEVNAVSPGVGLSLRGSREDGQSGDNNESEGGLENHDCNVLGLERGKV